ncbi:MAG: hypothetical protein Q9191_004296 [Dirinaria sp. TL-2023a]
MSASKPPLDGVPPFAGLLLSDYGATVLRIDRPQPDIQSAPTADSLARRKSSVAVDLKLPAAVALLKDILKHADVLIDPFRPGVIEGLGLIPKQLLAANPRLIIASLTGFRRDGKYKDMAGHDINYLAVSGVLSQLGRRSELPYAPANILADFAGGGLMCAYGILMALLSRERTGLGQVVENNMVDGAAYLATFLRYGLKTPLWNQPRGENMLDGGCPFYDTYECKDGGYMAVGALEPHFFQELVCSLKLENTYRPEDQFDRAKWPAMKKALERKFAQNTRSEWETLFNGADACCTPVLGQAELQKAGYGQRLPISLTNTPGLEIPEPDAWDSSGLAPGYCGEQILNTWFNWRRGKHYEIDNGSLVKIDTPKL